MTGCYIAQSKSSEESGVSSGDMSTPAATTTNSRKSKVSRLTDGRPAHRYGKQAIGLYPEVSRTKLAEQLDKHISTVTGYFMGRTKMPSEVLIQASKLMGVGIEVLAKELAEQRLRFVREQQAAVVADSRKRKPPKS